jgi:hypothetical protein
MLAEKIAVEKPRSKQLVAHDLLQGEHLIARTSVVAEEAAASGRKSKTAAWIYVSTAGLRMVDTARRGGHVQEFIWIEALRHVEVRQKTHLDLYYELDSNALGVWLLKVPGRNKCLRLIELIEFSRLAAAPEGAGPLPPPPADLI